ncbi:MAG: hypothetical protein QFX33_00430 [Candidatus Nezhaarchaeota archaeon]|nr:hypothetical protein [Candidatus Nezhaarchaeota archaeon]
MGALELDGWATPGGYVKRLIRAQLAVCSRMFCMGFDEAEEKEKRLVVDLTFIGSLKFWLAYLVVMVVAVIIGLALFWAFIIMVAQHIPQLPIPTIMASRGLLSTLQALAAL